MTKAKERVCTTKGCINPVFDDGKYCEYCKQVRKEKREKGVIVAATVGIPATFYAIKKGALKQIPKIAKTVIQVVLKK